MRSRYFLDSNGEPSIKAAVYDKDDHLLQSSQFDLNARKICFRLNQCGHEAYIVGGAIRDLLMGRVPKDFDVVTDASPGRVRKLFRSSRIIGKRFRLVHIYFPLNKFYEIATFRSIESGNRRNVYGSLYEDVMRRDFSINALYFDPKDEIIIDFIGGFADIKSRTLRSVLPLDTSFVEDPVRMLRALKYAAILRVSIGRPLARRIRKDVELLGNASNSRLSEELYKILSSGHSTEAFRLMNRYGLIRFLLPEFARKFDSHGGKKLRKDMFLELKYLDRDVSKAEVERGSMIARLCKRIAEQEGFFESAWKERSHAELVEYVKNLIVPLVQPNRDVENAVRYMFLHQGLSAPQRRRRKRKRRAI